MRLLFAAGLLLSSLQAQRLDLNGEWNLSVHGRLLRTVRVPSTYLPLGGATLEREFAIPSKPPGKRWLLKFDGIVMSARVALNGAPLGEFGPYTPFGIDVTANVVAGKNRLSVFLDDLDGIAPWGRAWITAFPRFGGIARDVFLDEKPDVYIENARLDYRFDSGYRKAQCRLTVWLCNTRVADVAIELKAALGPARSALKFTAAPGMSQPVLEFAVDPVRLWSPDQPAAYDLAVSLFCGGGEIDRFAALTGFKELAVRGQDFYLNGTKIFLKGIFRHDIQGYQGHTASRQQMERDIADIKALGCNFLRLGHYPHHKYVGELAARQGLLISGEPPVFSMSQQDRKVIEGAKFCLGGLIRRDWNNPAAAVWIVSNEVGTDLDYMREMSAFARELDPQRLVTIVDNTRWTAKDAPWEKFRQARIDFICQNAYGAGLDGCYEKLQSILPPDLPYVISEWGGPLNHDLVLKEGRYFLDHSSLARTHGPRISGLWFWEYQDIPMARWSPEGVLHWSLVDLDRRPYDSYFAVKSLYNGVPAPPPGLTAIPPLEEKLPRPAHTAAVDSADEPVDLSAAVNSDKVLAELKPASRFAYPETVPLGRVEAEGLPFELSRQVVMLSKANPVVRIPVSEPAEAVSFLGHVCFNTPASAAPAGPKDLPWINEAGLEGSNPPRFHAYPRAGAFGDSIGEYRLLYEDGSTETIRLENGVQFADYRLFFGFSHIDAVALETRQLVKYKSDAGAKSYQLRLFTYKPRKPGSRIQTIEFRLTSQNYVPILAAITIHRPVRR